MQSIVTSVAGLGMCSYSKHIEDEYLLKKLTPAGSFGACGCFVVNANRKLTERSET